MILKIGFYSKKTNGRDWLFIDNIEELKINSEIEEPIEYEDLRICCDTNENFVHQDFYLKLFFKNKSTKNILLSNSEKIYIINDEGKTIEKI